MSKAAANEAFARLAQARLKASGHYSGAIDGWAGAMTQAAFSAFAGSPPPSAYVSLDPAPPSAPPSAPSANPTHRLPRETNAAMTAFYGTPSPTPPNLDWFAFPGDGARLYSRTGTPLTRHRCHRILALRLTGALSDIYALLGKAEYERQGWHVYGGCHNYRAKRGGSTLSAHAWGIAVDFNPAENPLSSSKTSFSPAAVDIMERWGFLSGGRAWNRDWMHFQAAIPSISAGSHYAARGLPKNIQTA
jgi:hypothetical protein